MQSKQWEKSFPPKNGHLNYYAIHSMFVVFIQLLSGVWLCNCMNCSMPGFLVLYCLPEFAKTHVHWVSMLFNRLILYGSLLLLPSIFPNIRVFSNESALHIRWLRIRCRTPASASVFPMNIQHWFPLGWLVWALVVQETLRNLLQDYNSKASVLQHSAFLMVQLSHL